MILRKRYLRFIFVLMIIFSARVFSQPASDIDTLTINLPKVQREFRGAWIATVANINWPSRKDLTTQEQKDEAIKLLDLLKNCNYNAVIFQARPQCDALYKSDIEPWSYYLTGEQGKAPSPLYDPLEFWVEETHKRGMEFHVWLNPYRAHHVEGGEVTEHSVVKTHPDLVVELKSGYWWLDPGKKEVQDYSYSVVTDITKRYDIDGIHFDDYFYPYSEYNGGEDFPDESSYKQYTENNGKLNKSDWRRNNINNFIQRVYKGIKEIKPTVKFGISPFGVWRPGHPESIQGFDQYESLYADAKLWLNKGWMDYFTPQIYWSTASVSQSFPVILAWWKGENILNRHLWPGIYIVRGNNELNNVEVLNQIMISRAIVPESPGNIQYSIAGIVNSPELRDTITNGPYKKQALLPSTPWFNCTMPSSPEVNTEIKEDSLTITWDNGKAFSSVVYFCYGKKWQYKILTPDINSYNLPIAYEKVSAGRGGEETVEEFKLSHIAVSTVDRISNESKPAIIKIK